MNKQDNIFGERLKSLRALSGNISQKEFAKKLGIPQPTLSSYESGKIKPTVDAIINISDKCGVSMDWLCGHNSDFRIRSLSAVLAFFIELFETKEFSIIPTFHDLVYPENKSSLDDNERNWVNLKVYYDDTLNNPDCVRNSDLCIAITKAYKLTQELKKYEISQDSYEREKKYFIEQMAGIPLTKIDHSDISEEDQRKKMLMLMKAEWEAMEKTNAST
ncbi:MAG: helix-turn-helix domain-containing protein [Lachnospiraceae bacterium]|nr:helix-turn-helix domain-containing protein [Lachnospiraceae bacterium]